MVRTLTNHRPFQFLEENRPISPAAKADWQRIEKDAILPRDAKNGSPYRMFAERSITSEIRDDCAGDVKLLARL
jgi:hypothetical protein